MFYHELISILAAISPACWVLWTSLRMLNACACSQCICILLSSLALVAHSVTIYLIPTAIHSFIAILTLVSCACFSQPLPPFSQYVCALGVGFSLAARHSLIIQRSAGIHQLLRGSPRLQWSRGCYLSIHSPFHYHSLCFSTCMEKSHKPWGEKYASHLSNVISKSARANLQIWSRGGWLVALPMKETEWGHAGAGSSFSGIINSTCCSSTARRGGVTEYVRN